MERRILNKIMCLGICLLFCLSNYVSADTFDPTQDIALGCDAYSSTGVPELAVNGNDLNRWESGHQNDGEWWYVDLGNKYELNKIEILWEAAYGKSFELLATDVIPESGQQDAEWVSIYSVEGQILDGFPHQQEFDVNGKVGRYIKFQGIERGSSYGYSFFAFRVYANGLYIDAEDRELTTVNILPNPIVVIEDQELPIFINSYCNYGGVFKEVQINLTLNDDNAAEIIQNEGNYFIKGLVLGEYELTAVVTSTDGKGTTVTTSVEVNVIERRKVHEVIINETLPGTFVGRPIALSITCIDQYEDILLPEEEITWVLEGVGKISENNYSSFEVGEASVVAKIGDVESEPIILTCAAYPENIALRKPVEANGSVDNTPAELVNDGNDGTRWAYNPNTDDPEFRYEAWITIDLEEVYDIDFIEILWEGATAADYGIYYSLDNEEFGEAVYEMNDVEGMKSVTHQFYGNPAKARYVKMFSTRASTQWGVSIWEFRIYGTKDLAVEENDGEHVVLSGLWSEELFNGIDNVDISSYDMTQVLGVKTRPETLNPNCLIYASEISLIAKDVNVITGTSAAKIVLQDGVPFKNRAEFTAEEVEYIREFSETETWASLYLPFIVNVDGRIIEKLDEQKEDGLIFAEVNEIEAYTPYLIKVEESMRGTVQTFTANGNIVVVASTEKKDVSHENLIFTGTHVEIPALDKFVLQENGSEFTKEKSEGIILPFRAYIELEGTANIDTLPVFHDGEWVDGIASSYASSDLGIHFSKGIVEITVPEAQKVMVYTIEGKLVRELNLNEGVNRIVDLNKGIYLIHNKKVIIW